MPAHSNNIALPHRDPIDVTKRRSFDASPVYLDRRSGSERRHKDQGIQDKERRTGKDRRHPTSKLLRVRIPIFFKLASLSIFLSLFIIITISLLVLGQQKSQFIDQLMNMGKSMIRIVVKNSPDKLLSDEDLALFQLLNDIAENEQVVYALITDNHNMIKAHSSIEEAGKPYSPPRILRRIHEEESVSTLFMD